MNKENILLNIKGLQEKIEALDERLFEDDEAVSALDLDTQLMHLRLLYDAYLSLRPEGKKKGKVRKEKETSVPKVEETPDAVEEVETSLPLMFTDEVPETSGNTGTPDAGVETRAEAQPETEAAAVIEEALKNEEPVKAESPEKEEVSEIKEAQAEVKEEMAETAKEIPVVEEAPEVDLELLEEPEASDFDMDAIEFEDEPEDEAEDIPSVKKKEASADEEYEPYYPGLNPKAMEGEPEVGYATYASEKSTQTLGDRFAGQFPSLNDQLSQKRGEDRSLGSRKQKDQIHDLTKSIDLNLKFTFVRELFRGDARLLSEELNMLNQCGRLETALATFEEMKQRYHWKEDKDAVQQLYELILRKYSR